MYTFCLKAQLCNYFQCWKRADCHLMMTHIYPFPTGWVATKHLWGSGNDPIFLIIMIVPQLSWRVERRFLATQKRFRNRSGVVSRVLKRFRVPFRQILVCNEWAARLRLRLQRAELSPPLRQRVHCAADSGGTRRWQLKGASLCAAASSEDKTTEEKRPRETMQTEPLCLHGDASLRSRAGSSSLTPTRYFGPATLTDDTVWTSESELGHFLN